MQTVIFCHSLLSDWNHGNAHFLRGITTELIARGHGVRVYEPVDSWSLENLVKEEGGHVYDEVHHVYPHLRSNRYDAATLNLQEALRGADLVVVHEWNDPELVARIGRHRAKAGQYRLLFHDTHHRMVSQPEAMRRYDLTHYDGVLAFGDVIRDLYLERGLTPAAWTWHEAADTRVFRPHAGESLEGDLVWIGNWGDEERTAELHEFLLGPVKRLGLRARVYGVRYPADALRALDAAGIEYGGYLPNYRVPEVFARYRVTVHIPRRYYATHLPGIPTIRPFEAMACGIPLVCSPWRDAERLFNPGRDYLIADDGQEMAQHLRTLLKDPERSVDQADHALCTVRDRHTCAHRVNQLLDICRELDVPAERLAATRPSSVVPTTSTRTPRSWQTA